MQLNIYTYGRIRTYSYVYINTTTFSSLKELNVSG